MEILSSVDDDAGFPMPPSSNRKQVAIFVVLTLVLSVAAVWGGRAWFKSTHTLTFAVGADDSTTRSLPRSSQPC